MKIGNSFAVLLVLVGLSFASTAADLFAGGSAICKLLSLLPYGGVLAMTVGGTMAGISYMSHDQESRFKAKSGIEGLVLGGALILILPTLIGFFFGMTVC